MTRQQLCRRADGFEQNCLQSCIVSGDSLNIVKYVVVIVNHLAINGNNAKRLDPEPGYIM